jgi:hypothetical protein
MEDPNALNNSNGVAGPAWNTTLDANGNVYESLQASQTLGKSEAEIQKDHQEVKDSISTLHADNPIPHLRTFQSDIADAMKQQDGSMIKVAVKQNNGRISTKTEDIADPKRSIYVLLLSGLLIVGGLAAIGGLILVLVRPKVVPIPQLKPEEIIPIELTKTVAIEPNQSSLEVLAAQLSLPPEPQDALMRILLTEQKADPKDPKTVTTSFLDAQAFATRMKSSMPEWLLRSLKPEYVAGIHFNGIWHPFIIFKTSSYENAFSGMLKWEDSMSKDLATLIQIPESVKEVTASSSVSTASVAARPFGFKDIVIKNKDVRAWLNADGVPILMYSFPDKDTIIITGDESTLQEIFTKLTTTKFIR